MKLHSVQMLRGLAAITVMIYHIRASETQLIGPGPGQLPLVGGLFTNGFLGVDLFFVISGFIMVFVAAASPASPRVAAEFLFARFARIYPLWWVFAALMTAYMLLTYGLHGEVEAGFAAIGRGIPPVEYLVKSFLLAPQPDHPILGVGWTLVHEVHFYVVFALVLLAPPRVRPWLVAAWGGLVLAGALMGLSSPIAGTLLELATYPMTLEFILGAGVGWLVTSGRRWRPALVSAIAVFWLVFAACAHAEVTEWTLSMGRVLWFGLPCVLLVYGFASLDIEGRLSALVPPVMGAAAAIAIFQTIGLPDPATAPARMEAALLAVGSGGAVCVFVAAIGLLSARLGGGMPGFLTAPARTAKSGAVALGDWSYALYLSHIFVLQGLQRVFSRLEEQPGWAGALFNVPAEGRLGNTAYVIACIIGSIVIAWLAYRMIEQPVIRGTSSLRRTLFSGNGAQVRPAEVRAAVW
jgi:peptidoglycan/LPS O-acetylase OafA/YrhL